MIRSTENNAKLEKQIELWLKELEPVFDMPYLITKKNMLNTLNDGVYYSGLEKLKEIKKTSNARIMYVSEHLSEQDFFEIPKLFYREDIEIPATFAGINLLVRGLTKPSFLIRTPLIVDFKKSGTIVINRNLLQKEGKINSAYKRTYLQFLDGVKDDSAKGIEERQSVFSNHDTLIFNYGRSRDGKVRNYEFHTLSSFHHHSLKNPESNHIIAPISITLERCIEDSSFDIQNLIKNSKLPWVEKLASRYNWAKKINDNWIRQTGRYGAVADVMSFLFFYLRKQPRGEIYLDFGEPINVADFSKNEKSKLMETIAERINSKVRVTPTSLVSLILKEHPRDYISRPEMLEKINIARKKMPGDLLLSNYLLENRSDEEVLDRALLFLNEKRNPRTLTYFPSVNTYKIKKQSFLIEYYSNRIEHHNTL